MYGWSQFDETRNIDFHSVLWQRPQGNVLVDPLPLSEHDQAHLEQLGGAAWIVITNSDHARASQAVAELTGARIAGPALEQDEFPLSCDRWLANGDDFEGLTVLALDGSKTPGELALLVEGTTLITGDLIRAHEGGKLTLLPDAKLADRPAAIRSLHRVVEASAALEAVLPGDGWPVFVGGRAALCDLVARSTDN
jgi:glyoxylase-like metal-dependent hydrolase (beta-lactamase superfamily II)